MCGGRRSRIMAAMHSLNAPTFAGELVAERIDSASRRRRFGRIRRRFTRRERRVAPSSPVPPGRLRTSDAGR